MKKLTCFKPVKVIYEGDMVIEIGEKEEIQQEQQQEIKEYKEEPMKDIRIDMNHQSIYFDMNDIHSYNKFENEENIPDFYRNFLGLLWNKIGRKSLFLKFDLIIFFNFKSFKK